MNTADGDEIGIPAESALAVRMLARVQKPSAHHEHATIQRIQRTCWAHWAYCDWSTTQTCQRRSKLHPRLNSCMQYTYISSIRSNIPGGDNLRERLLLSSTSVWGPEPCNTGSARQVKHNLLEARRSRQIAPRSSPSYPKHDALPRFQSENELQGARKDLNEKNKMISHFRENSLLFYSFFNFYCIFGGSKWNRRIFWSFRSWVSTTSPGLVPFPTHIPPIHRVCVWFSPPLDFAFCSHCDYTDTPIYVFPSSLTLSTIIKNNF